MRSVLEQTYTNIQVLVVDDNSKDSSYELVKDIAADDSRVKVIKLQNNSGVSVARNMGIRISEGDYIAFLDSDDYLDENFLEKLEELSKLDNESADIVFCGYKFVSSDRGIIKEAVPDIKEGRVYNAEEIMRKIIYGSVSIWTGSAMYRREMIKKANLWFTPGAINGQDREFIWKSVVNAKSSIGTRAILSNYFQQEHSLVRNPSFTKIHTLGCKLRFEKYLLRMKWNQQLIDSYRRRILYPSYVEFVYFMVSAGFSDRKILEIVRNKRYLEQMGKIKLGDAKIRKLLTAKGLRLCPLLVIQVLKVRHRLGTLKPNHI